MTRVVHPPQQIEHEPPPDPRPLPRSLAQPPRHDHRDDQLSVTVVVDVIDAHVVFVHRVQRRRWRGGRDRPRGRWRRRCGNDDNVHNNDCIFVHHRPFVVRGAGQRWRCCLSFPCPRHWILLRNDDGHGGSRGGPSAATAPAGNPGPPPSPSSLPLPPATRQCTPPPKEGSSEELLPVHAVDDDDAPRIPTTIHRDQAHCRRRHRAFRCLPGEIPMVRPLAPQQQPCRTSTSTAAARAAFAVATAIAAEGVSLFVVWRGGGGRVRRCCVVLKKRRKKSKCVDTKTTQILSPIRMPCHSGCCNQSL